MGLGDYSGPMM